MTILEKVENVAAALGAGIVIGSVLALAVFAGQAVATYKASVLVQGYASKVEEVRVERAYMQFLYQVCRDKAWDENKLSDRAKCTAVIGMSGTELSNR